MKKEIETAVKSVRTKAEACLYTVGWSEDDEAYVAQVAEFPALAAHGDSEQAALRSLQQVVKSVLKEMAISNQSTPHPFG